MKNAIDAMVNEIIRIMDGDVYGIWLYGSVVMDDFRPGWSDIDFVVLTRGEISETRAEQLLTLRQQMLEKEPGNPYYRSFEGSLRTWMNTGKESSAGWSTGEPAASG